MHKRVDQIDKHARLEAQPFSFRMTKDNKVFIQWNGRQILVLKGAAAGKLLEEISEADTQQIQLILARATGHFKHGNERQS